MDALPIGTKFFTSQISTGVAVIVDPVANTGGVVVKTATLVGSLSSFLSTGTAPLTSAGDKTKPVLLWAGTSPVNLQYPVIIPPGQGLWLFAAGSSASAFVTYDLVP